MASRLVVQWCPPALRAAANRVLGSHTRYLGPFAHWSEAASKATGYDDGAIVQRVEEATRRVLSGETGYEQDGVVRDGHAPPTYALPALLLAAARCKGRLSVLDFGGALASHYLRWHAFLQDVPNLQWCVVEQPRFVESGTGLFESVPAVAFRQSVEQAAAFTPNAVLASGVLQYLEDALEILATLAALNAEVLILDRTPFATSGGDCILVQQVPASLGPASYPLRVLTHAEVESQLRNRYDKIMEFPSGDAPIRIGDFAADYLGQVWVRRA